MITLRQRILPIGKRYVAINLFGVLFIKSGTYVNEELLSHETIHSCQIRELGYIFFYIIYIFEWLFLLFRYHFDGYRAYRAISFEREAYGNQSDRNYLKRRKKYAMWR